MGLAFRPVQERDLDRAGDVVFVASYHAAVGHGVAAALSTPGESRTYVRRLAAVDPLGGILAEEDGDIVGLGWLHPRGTVATLGPVVVTPRAQGRGIGRQLIARCLEVAGTGVPQVRLVQESHDMASLGLCLRTGFRVVTPLLAMGLPAGTVDAASAHALGPPLRVGTLEDRDRLVDRDRRAFGAPRPRDIDRYLEHGRVLVADGTGGLAGFALGIRCEHAAYLGSAAAEDVDLLLVLLGAMAAELARSGVGVHTLVPATDRRLVDGLLGAGFRVFHACHYMVRGGGIAPPPGYVLMSRDLM